VIARTYQENCWKYEFHFSIQKLKRGSKEEPKEKINKAKNKKEKDSNYQDERSVVQTKGKKFHYVLKGSRISTVHRLQSK